MARGAEIPELEERHQAVLAIGDAACSNINAFHDLSC
jgi:hypothetical protein